ncbi:MAG: hypothetical protein C4547_09425 [Phycisphaerales bacterium]|nr:MAG: hypothetical protein C4547_09425 [Phycisphaerales bacterium]
MDIIDVGVLLLVVLTIVVAALFAFLIWRNGYIRGWRASRRNQTPMCPACGYNMAGLSHCRCPECGRTYSLDSLWRAYLFKTDPRIPQAVRQEEDSPQDKAEVTTDA